MLRDPDFCSPEGWIQPDQTRCGPSVGPLGSKRKNVGRSEGAQGRPEQQTLAEEAARRRQARKLLRELAADQRTAASIYHSMVPEGGRAAGRGVCLCGWTQIKGQATELWRAEEQGGARAFYKGLSKCRLRWVCPVCTRAASEEARETLNSALAAAREAAFVPVLVTLTARHHAGMTLADLWERLSQAKKALKDLRGWKRMNAKGGVMVGFAKAVEATYGRHGWHPHFHLLMVMRAGDEAEAMQQVEWLRKAWLSQLDSVGLDGTSEAARRRAFDVQGAAQAGSYVTKWGAAEELALAGAKTGRDGGRTPWQLLRDARTAGQEADRRRAAARWWEFTQVFKGVHQVRLSPSLKALIADHKQRNPSQDQDPEVEAGAVVMAFGTPEWEAGRWRRMRMREAAEDASREGAREAVLAVLLDECSDRDDLAPPDDPGPLIEASSATEEAVDEGYQFAQERQGGGDQVKVEFRHGGVSSHTCRHDRRRDRRLTCTHLEARREPRRPMAGEGGFERGGGRCSRNPPSPERT